MRSVQIVFIGAVLVYLGGACKETTEAAKGDSTVHASADIEKLSRELSLKLPAGTRVVGVKREWGMDDAVFVKMEIAKADWQAFLRDAPFKLADLDKTGKTYLPADEGWWDPNQAEGVRATQIQLEGGRWLNVGVDDTRGGNVVVVYAMNHGT